VNGLILDAPQAVLFKGWARRQGFPLLVVRWHQPDKPNHRIVVSVPPSMRGGLRGLGSALEEEETNKRAANNKPRPKTPRRFPEFDTADPWYDGRSPLHAYTIVDSPRVGTVLDVEQVKEMLTSSSWLPK
jgi:hypothetical protein